jgi:hypothetical protein
MFLIAKRAIITGLGLVLIDGAAVGFSLAHLAGAGRQTPFLLELNLQDIATAEVNRALALSPQPAAMEPQPDSTALPADKDDDGMADSWERAKGFSSSNPGDAWLDADNDYVVNLFEYQLGSNPRSASSPPVVTVGTSSAADYRSLADALNRCPSGSVIHVARGTYRVNYMTFSPKTVMIQGGWNADFTSRDLKLNPVTLDGANNREVLYFSFSSGTNGIILDGLKIIRGKGSFGAANFLAQGSAFMKVSVFNCLILQSGSLFSFGSVLNFHNWGNSLSDRTVANSVIAGNSASGIYAQVTQTTRARWRILHAAIYGNKNGGGDNGYGIESFTLDNGVLNAHVFNSILWGNAEEDISIRRNIVFNVDHTDLDRVLAEFGARCNLGAGNLDANPAFTAPGSGNFHLKSSSPLINKGINKGVPQIDFEGEKRVKGAAPDIGPDERWDGKHRPFPTSCLAE